MITEVFENDDVLMAINSRGCTQAFPSPVAVASSNLSGVVSSENM